MFIVLCHSRLYCVLQCCVSFHRTAFSVSVTHSSRRIYSPWVQLNQVYVQFQPSLACKAMRLTHNFRACIIWTDVKLIAMQTATLVSCQVWKLISPRFGVSNGSFCICIQTRCSVAKLYHLLYQLYWCSVMHAWSSKMHRLSIMENRLQNARFSLKALYTQKD